MLKKGKRLIFLLPVLYQLLNGVEASKTCNETFCGKLRRSPEGFPSYTLDLSTVIVESFVLSGNVTSSDGLNTYLFIFSYLFPFTYQIVIGNASVLDYFMSNTAPSPLEIEERTDETIVVTYGSGKGIIYSKPFKIEFYFENKLVHIINGNGRLVIQNNSTESFAAADITFEGAQQAYGIPLHADNLALRTTTDGNRDPYRLFNHNSGEYRLKSTEALHSSIPVLYTHGISQSAGMYMLGGYSQTWVDITHRDNSIETYSMFESPYVFYVLYSGPTIADVITQDGKYLRTKGFSLPQYFALGYHQSRNSYANEDEVLDVLNNFNKNNFPLEAIWLDANHTDKGKYFTWDPLRFPDPVRLQSKMAAENRSLVVTLSSHIKVEKGYFVHDEATSKGYYIRYPNGSDYVGKCLPGDSSYLDFANEELDSYYKYLLSLETFRAGNLHVFYDLNEPTVFENEQHENTLPPDLLHRNGKLSIPHVFLHNVYPMFQTFQTFLDLQNNPLKGRPFIATRSDAFVDFNFGPLIIEDNYANWEHLQISFPMCLTEALVNMNMCGVSVAGFAGIPNEELYQRWYQAGAWLPFYRAHFASNVPPREPYRYSEEVKTRVRKAMYQRYAHLPNWYTLFFENLLTSKPIIRPLFYQYPQDEATFTIDHQLLLGANILVAPILKRGAFLVSVYLPGGGSELWYNIDDNYKVFRGTGHQLLNVNLDSVPVFYRGGSIIVRKDMPRLTTAATVNDPYTLYICLNATNEASGTLYVDDYKTYAYIALEYLYIGLSFTDNSLYAYKIAEQANYDGAAPIGEIVILNPPKNIKNVQLTIEDKVSDNLAVITYTSDKNILKLSNISLNLQKAFKLTLI